MRIALTALSLAALPFLAGAAPASSAIPIAVSAPASSATANVAPPPVAAASTLPPRVIHVVGADNYPPYLFRDEDGRPTGLVADEWALWEKKTGVHVDLQPVDWADALRRVVLAWRRSFPRYEAIAALRNAVYACALDGVTRLSD